MQTLTEILGDKHFWKFEVRARQHGTATAAYGRQELHLAVQSFFKEIYTGNEHVELYVVMVDGDPARVDDTRYGGVWERLIAWPDPDDVLTAAWTSQVWDVHAAAMDIEVVFT